MEENSVIDVLLNNYTENLGYDSYEVELTENIRQLIKDDCEDTFEDAIGILTAYCRETGFKDGLKTAFHLFRETQYARVP